ncbi:ribbon-helix-helix protein, CopG family [Kitasatospora sp. NPDC059327]|uniref:ribbon-helix-helix protein, CopG family n=1 Tax=Kitasatospora sp. NPDC059327 TaxID=3346803 RepID=UPI0036897075
MPLKRVTVSVETEDLAVLRAAAARSGTTVSALVRDAVHLAAMSSRTWDEPFFSATYTPVAEAADAPGPGQSAVPGGTTQRVG